MGTEVGEGDGGVCDGAEMVEREFLRWKVMGRGSRGAVVFIAQLVRARDC